MFCDGCFLLSAQERIIEKTKKNMHGAQRITSIKRIFACDVGDSGVA